MGGNELDVLMHYNRWETELRHSVSAEILLQWRGIQALVVTLKVDFISSEYLIFLS
jgi:hypothetical protein